MAEFLNPFSGLAPDKKMSLSELIRAIRLSIAAEEEAIHLYTAHADATDHPLAKKVLLDIADEERVHAGEFLHLLQILTQDENQFLAEGKQEVEEMREEVRQEGKAVEGEPPTVGPLKEN